MKTDAVVITGPHQLSLESLNIKEPGKNDVVVDIHFSGISTGTEKLFWTGEMPPFPGMGYPLVPGYESVGEVVEAPVNSELKSGDFVFVPGANCYGEVKGLFGGASKRLVTSCSRIIKIDSKLGADGALFALAATARHSIAGLNNQVPELIVGHGVLGRLLARLTIAAGGQPPIVWELSEERRSGAIGYEVIHPDSDSRQDYGTIFDASGDPKVFDTLVGRLTKGGEVVLAGFYPGQIAFGFASAFIKEARFRISSEFNKEDVRVTRALIDAGSLSLEGLISHKRNATDFVSAYEKAFNDPKCLKMIIDWSRVA